MENNLETLSKIKNFFKDLGINGENIMSEMKSLQNENAVIERYYNIIRKNNDVSKHQSLKTELDSHSTFCVIYKSKDVLSILKKIFKEDISFSDRCFCIKSRHSELFLKILAKYRDKINWRSLSWERRFKWSLENIDKGIDLDIWDWTELSKNPALPWSFEFVEKYKDFIKWKYVKVNNYLEWNEDKIIKYSNYIFSSENITNTSELPFNTNLIDKFRLEFELNNNIKWTHSLIEKFANRWNWKSLSKINILLDDNLIDKYNDKWDWQSLTRNINILFDDNLIDKYNDKWDFKYLSKIENISITTQIIEKYYDKWDWEEMVRNLSVKLEFRTIDKLKDILDWNYLIIQPHLIWNEELIDKYSNYIFRANNEIENKRTYGSHFESYCMELNHTGYFESNENVLWTDSLIEKYSNKFNWDYLCKNSVIHFSTIQIEKYKNFINWDLFFNYGNTEWNESLIDMYIDKSNIDNLIGNSLVNWDQSMFKKYIKNKSIFTLSKFCKNSKISNDIIFQNQAFWSSKEISVSHRFNFSDFGVYYAKTYHTLWKDLFNNKNIVWNDKLLESCLKNIVINEMFFTKLKLSVEFINKYWNYNKEENVWHVGNYDTGTYCKKSTVYFRECINYCEITNLDLIKFIENEYKWIDSSLINSNSCTINKSIENLILKEFEKRNFIKEH